MDRIVWCYNLLLYCSSKLYVQVIGIAKNKHGLSLKNNLCTNLAHLTSVDIGSNWHLQNIKRFIELGHKLSYATAKLRCVLNSKLKAYYAVGKYLSTGKAPAHLSNS